MQGNNTMRRYLIPITVELLGISLIAVGIGVEIATGAELGYALITSGSLIMATGSLVWAKIIRRR